MRKIKLFLEELQNFTFHWSSLIPHIKHFLLYFPVSVINTMTKSHCGEERAYSSYRSQSIMKQTGESRLKKKNGGRNWSRTMEEMGKTASWLVLHCSACFLIIQQITTCPWIAPPWLGHPSSIFNQDNAPQVCLQSNLMDTVP